MRKLTALLFLIAFSAVGQNSQKRAVYWHELDNLRNLHSSRKISDTTFLVKTDSLLNSFIMHRIASFDSDSLINVLEEFRKLAWSKNKYDRYKRYYYAYLSSNSEMIGKRGQAIFYAEKVAVESKRQGVISLMAHGLILHYYKRVGDNQRIVKYYKQEQSSFDEIYSYLLTGKDKGFENSINTVYIYAMVATAFLDLQKVKEAEELLKRIKKLEELLNSKKNTPESVKVSAMVKSTILEIEILLKQKKDYEAYTLITAGDKKLTESRSKLGKFGDVFFNDFKFLRVAYYNSVGEYKRAKELLDPLNHAEFQTIYDQIVFNTHESGISANLGDYKTAYLLEKRSVDLYKKEIENVSSETDNLLYAYTEAEFNRKELQEAEKVKTARLNIIFLISILSGVFLLLNYYRRRKEKQRTAQNIAQLNKMTEVLIEEAKQNAIKEEQRKLGQDLHDDMSGSLASLLNIIHTLETNENNAQTKEKLTLVHDRTEQIYKSVRNKSHIVYKLSTDPNSDNLEESVAKIVSAALPSGKYTKEIEIDKSASALLSVNVRIEILRIVQEAMNNVIKHAKSANEVFIFLYKESENIIIEIGDNGKVKNVNTTSGIGLQSIKDRVHAIGGKIEIDTSQGMVLKIRLKA